MVLLEVCIDSREGLRAAVEGRAQRLEVCARLDLDGLTPDDALLVEAVASGLPCVAMIRPRPGDHVQSSEDVRGMIAALLRAKELGAQGFALGALTPDGDVDRPTILALVELAAPLPVTFHRAFDVARDRFAALETLVELGVQRVLTSGGAPDASKGRHVLRQLVERSRGRITVVAGGGVRATNVHAIVEESGVTEVHSSKVFPIG